MYKGSEAMELELMFAHMQLKCYIIVVIRALVFSVLPDMYTPHPSGQSACMLIRNYMREVEVEISTCN